MQSAKSTSVSEEMALSQGRRGELLPATEGRLFPSLRPLWSRLKCTCGYDIRLARTVRQHDLVSSLVRRMYAWRGYSTESLAHRPDDPNRLTLAAWQCDELAATLTLGRDGPQGLQTDALYARELASLRHPGRVLCEVSRLAVDPDFSSPDLLGTLFQSALRHAREIFSASDFVIGVNPRHAGYYRRRMGFHQIGKLQQCRRLDAPVVLLHRVLAS